MSAFLHHFQDPSAISYVTNFSIIYIKMGFPRLNPLKAAEVSLNFEIDVFCGFIFS